IWQARDGAADNVVLAPFTAVFYQLAVTDATWGNLVNLTYKAIGRHLSPGGGDEVLRNGQPFPYADFLELSIDRDGNFSDECRIIVGDDYSAGFVAQYEDAVKMYTTNPDYPNIYSIAEDNTSLAFNKMPFKPEVPLGVRLNKEGTYTIGVKDLVGYADKYILLEDKVLNKTQDLREGSYTFESGKEATNERFVLRFTDNYTNKEDIESNVVIYTENNTVFVRNIHPGDKVQIYNTSGSLVVNDVASGNEVSYSLNNGAGVYIVKITGSTVLVDKVILK
ncbi:MAG: T9SS type A sorting domain-containing protein, partial [Dysgonamonadaceae bacterium]|nr:T9SS type A sorting domain-containing protein [Dysgonamonadaceae bacterium]